VALLSYAGAAHAAEHQPLAVRVGSAPLITPSSGNMGTNINGPSVIAAPSWLAKPLDAYYMYFGHHNGKWIRLATAPNPGGPWTVQADKVLPIGDLKKHGFSGHVASPDIHVDHKAKKILCFFHAPARWNEAYASRIRSKFSQLTGVALSADGKAFVVSNDQALTLSYLRGFQWNKRWYGLTARELVYRSDDKSWPHGNEPFE